MSQAPPGKFDSGVPLYQYNYNNRLLDSAHDVWSTGLMPGTTSKAPFTEISELLATAPVADNAPINRQLKDYAPLSYMGHTLALALNATDLMIRLNKIDGMHPHKIIKIDNEKLRIVTVLPATYEVTVDRGVLGTTASSHMISSLVLDDSSGYSLSHTFVSFSGNNLNLNTTNNLRSQMILKIGSEKLRITGVNSTTQVSVDRAVLGSFQENHAPAAPVSILFFEEDGAHSLNIMAVDRARNWAVGPVINFNTDLNGPCGHDSHLSNCSITVNGVGVKATNNPRLTVFAAATDGSGSGIETADSMQLAFRHHSGSTDPAPVCVLGDADKIGKKCITRANCYGTLPSPPVPDACPASADQYVDLPRITGTANNSQYMNYAPVVSDFAICLNEDCTGNVPPQGWYVVCARYKDKAGNVTNRSTTGYVPDLTLDNHISGDVQWDSTGTCAPSATKVCGKYGHPGVCATINFDNVPPPSAEKLVVSVYTGVTTDSLLVADFFAPGTNLTIASEKLLSAIADPVTYNTETLSPIVDLIGAATVLPWTNKNIVRVRWKDPVEAAPASPVTGARFWLSQNYAEDPLADPPPMPPSAADATGQDVTAQGKEASATNETKYFDLAYDPALRPDGCKNLHLLLKDEAGNFTSPNSFNLHSILYCFDGKKPSPTGDASANDYVRFYSYNTMQKSIASGNAVTDKLDESLTPKKIIPANADTVDGNGNYLDANLFNAEISAPVTNKKDRWGDNDSIMIVIKPFEDTPPANPSGGIASGMANDKAYRLCWSTSLSTPPDPDAAVPPATCRYTTAVSNDYLYSDHAGTPNYFVVFKLDISAFTTNHYYFFITSKDKAGNVSDAVVRQLIIDSDPPCQGNECGFTITNAASTIDMTSASAQAKSDFLAKLNAGMAGFVESGGIFKSPIIAYLTCGVPSGENCDTSATSSGGQRLNLTVSAGEPTTGAGISVNGKSLMFGTGIDVWSGSSEEAILWHDALSGAPADAGQFTDQHLTPQQARTSGNITINMHFFKGKTGNDHTYYQANPPTYKNFDDADAASNIERIQFSVGQGQEVVRNLYMKVRDNAGNWNQFDTPYIYQTLVLDTKPPNRITFNTAAINYFAQTGMDNLNVREQNGIIEYCSSVNDCSAGSPSWSADILQMPVTKVSVYNLNFINPIDLSGTAGVDYKLDTPPTTHVDRTAYVGTNDGILPLTAVKNFQVVYLWIRDNSGNPSSDAVPFIENYYKNGPNCAYGANGVLNYLTSPDCKVLRIEIPFDGTAPVFGVNDRPYLLNAALAEEATYINTPVINFKGATDSVGAGLVPVQKESGLRPTNTYKICYSANVGGCDNNGNPEIWVSDATGVATDLNFTPATPLSEGWWYLSVRAYDKAGNESQPSPGKRILVDTMAPCEMAGDTCTLAVSGSPYSVAQRPVNLEILGEDAGAGVDLMQVAEYIDNAGTCTAVFWTSSGLSAPFAQACTSNIDFTLAPANSEVTYSETLNGFTLSDSDGTKKLQIRYRDAAGKWSLPVTRTVILDRVAPERPAALTVNPGGWSASDTFLVQIDMPTGAFEDLSSQGGPDYGIGAVFYRVGQLPTSDSDGVRIPLGGLIFDTGTQKYSVPVQSVQNGVRDVYIWLEDKVGNRNAFNRLSTQIRFDTIVPSSPSGVQVATGSSQPVPTIQWTASVDNESGLRPTNTYRLCWSVTLGSCTFSVYTNNTTQYTLPAGAALTPNVWYFTVYSYDNVGNESVVSSTISHVVQEDKLMLDYLGVGDYMQSVFSPNNDKEGVKGFKVLYTHTYNRAPSTAALYIDLNGNGAYDLDEIKPLTKSVTGIYGDADFANGEEYYLDLPITFNRASSGITKFKFVFTEGANVAVAGTTNLDPDAEHKIVVSRYDQNFDGIAQVRNNVQRPGDTKPVVIILRPPANTGALVSIRVLNGMGKIVHSLIAEKPFNALSQVFVYWDKNDQFGQNVASGSYYIQIRVGDEMKQFPVLIIR